MSSTLDPAKLKVVELRAELSKRGLDSKGNKPALVKRLKDALEKELKQELPDTSIADTSTEDLDTSQTENQAISEESKVPEEELEKTQQEEQPSQQEKSDGDAPEVAPDKEEKMETDELPPSAEDKTPPSVEDKIPPSVEDKVPPSVEDKLPEQSQQLDDLKNTEKSQDTGDSSISENKENGEEDDSSFQKSHQNSDSDNVQPAVIKDKNQTEVTEIKIDKDSEAKGEKRKRSSPSPDRSQRRRSKSPVKEDEPPIDQDKVQLSWYDSDLHLQVDKESFLSAKPYHEGAFGFAWAGVRTTHGVNTGKVCFEVKITEELKWEDFSKYYDRHRRDQNKFPPKQKAEDEKKNQQENKSEEEKKKEESEDTEQENGSKSQTIANNDEEMKDLGSISNEDIKKIDDQGSEAENKPELKDEENVINEEKEEKTEKLEEQNEEKDQGNKEPVEPLPTHLFRVGWSLINTGLQLGEEKHSYGYESTGRFVINKEFQDYGIKFGVGDVVSSFLCINDKGITISYAINGISQSDAITIPPAEIPENSVLFPHVLSRNYAFELNLGSKEESWFGKPSEYDDYQFLDKIENKIPGPARPDNRSDCEVILMCGLPASGKTHWVREYVQANPDKRYTVLGNTQLLEKMTVSGYELKSKYKGSWNVLLEKLQKCLNKLIELAALRRRNYIIDQPNVYPSAQRRKLRSFEGFKRRAVVVVVGDEEQAKRQSLQEAEGGKDVPDSVVLDMKANMSLPQKGDWIDEVEYVGVGEEEAKALIQKYNTQARETIGIQRRSGHRDDRQRWQNRRNDYRGNYRDRNYHNRYDRGPPRPGNWHPRQGGWNRDRRDNRGPPVGGPREWRNRGNTRDRGSREIHNQGNSYNRNRNQPGRGSGGNWPSNWSQNPSNWGANQSWGGQGSWGAGWSGQSNQNQWKYGGGQGGGYGGYSNWSYYGQYPQNWGQGQSSGSTANQYGQYSQQDWAQYAQQYAQQGQNTSGSATTQSTSQK